MEAALRTGAGGRCPKRSSRGLMEGAENDPGHRSFGASNE